MQNHDYKSPEYRIRKDVELHWIGHPLDRPNDVRSRQFMLVWNTPNHLQPDHVQPSDAVFRIVYNCNGSCSWPERATGAAVDDEEQDDDDELEDAPRSKARIQCNTKGRLQVHICLFAIQITN